MDMPDPSSATLRLLAGKYFQIASFIMLAYDHMLTFGQEVEVIWKRPISFATILFFLNRYANLMQCIILVVAFHEPDWRGEPYVLVPLHKNDSKVTKCVISGVTTMFYLRARAQSLSSLAIGQIILILRVVAIYEGSKKIFAFLLSLWAGQLVISAVGLRTGLAVPFPPGFVGCILTGTDALFPAMWIAPLITDSCIFLLTIYRTGHNIGQLFASFRSEGPSITSRAVMILLRDGVMYYFLIFLTNLMTALIYFFAPPDIKPIGAPFNQLLTCTMISRLVLNLRALSSPNQCNTIRGSAIQFNNQLSTSKQIEMIWTRTLDDFTEDNSNAFDEAPLPAETIPHGNDDTIDLFLA